MSGIVTSGLRSTICALLGLLLVGCNLVSDRPLLSADSGQAIFEDGFFALRWHDGFAIDENGKHMLFEARWTGQHYRNSAGTGETYSFHPVLGKTGLFILQLSRTTGDTTYYVTARTERGLEIHAIGLNDAIVERLSAGNHRLVERKDADDFPEHVASTAAAVRMAASLWIETKYEDAAPTPDAVFLVGSDADEKADLVAKLAHDKCLALAGHVADPDVSRLPGNLKDGVSMGAIDTEQARPACEHAVATSRSPSIRYSMARIHFQNEEYDETNRLVDDLIDERFPLAFIMRADQLHRGVGLERDVAAARRLIERQAPNAAAIHYFHGRFLDTDIWGEPDPRQAFAAYQRAANMGFAAAKTMMGRAYRDGRGVTKDPERGYSLISDAAEEGDRFAHYDKADALYFGIGTEQDREAAFKSYRTAANRGVATAYYPLGFMLARGQGTEKKADEGVVWLRKAVDFGNVAAKGELGWMTYRGDGTTRDEAAGLTMIREAADAGDGNAKGYLEQIEQARAPAVNAPPSPLPDAPEEVRADVRKLAENKPFRMNETNLPFMAGMAQHFHEACGLPSDASDRAEAIKLILNGTAAMGTGMDYSNPNLGEAMGSMAKTQALFAAGTVFARQVGCRSSLADTMASAIAQASRSATQAADGGTATFVKTCGRIHGETRCSCVADVGRSAIPDIHQRPYSRDLVYQIIQRNPFLGFAIGGLCGLVNY